MSVPFLHFILIYLLFLKKKYLVKWLTCPFLHLIDSDIPSPKIDKSVILVYIYIYIKIYINFSGPKFGHFANSHKNINNKKNINVLEKLKGYLFNVIQKLGFLSKDL